MAQSTYTDTELLTEHFGYPPVSLLDDIINSINILAERALNSVEQGLLNAPPASLGFKPPPKTRPPSSAKEQREEEDTAAAAARHEIENGTHQLETLLCASIDRAFDKFELYVLRNILVVRPEDRPWIRLSHYDGLDLAGVQGKGKGKGKKSAGDGGDDGDDDDRPSVESVGALRRRLQASLRLNVLLHAERARNEALLRELRAVVVGGRKEGAAAAAGVGEPAVLFGDGPEEAKADPDTTVEVPAPLAFLRDRGSLTDGDAERPLTTTTAFTLSQLQALRALSTSLHNILPDLAEGGGGRDVGEADLDGPKGWRSERLEYVESATRKHLENVRGLELGRSGEVTDGEWQGEGRSVAPGEVQALEMVAAMLGGSSEPRTGDDAMDET